MLKEKQRRVRFRFISGLFPEAAGWRRHAAARARLALGAKVAAASGDDQALDGPAASAARFAGALVNAKLGKEISGPAFDVNVIPKAGALEFDGALEHFLNGAEQGAGLARVEPAGRGERVQARQEESFVRIDIAQASQLLLIHQPTLDGPTAVTESRKKLWLRNLRRVRSELAEDFFELLTRAASQPPEAPRVAIANLLPAVIQGQARVGVRFERRVARLHGELARHSQSNKQEPLPGGAIFLLRSELDRQRFALAPRAQDLAPRDAAHEFFRRSRDDLRVAHFRRAQPAPHHTIIQAAQDGFDFGKLGHNKRSGKL
jgi:hypothetical protein